MASFRFASPALLLLLAGCVSGPDHVPPEMPLPSKFSEGGAKNIGDVSTAAWWTGGRRRPACGPGASVSNGNAGGDPDAIRTRDPGIRNPVLYPAELRGRRRPA